MVATSNLYFQTNLFLVRRPVAIYVVPLTMLQLKKQVRNHQIKICYIYNSLKGIKHAKMKIKIIMHLWTTFQQF